VSVDLAIWEGPPPANDDEARIAFADLADRFLGPRRAPPTAKIATYLRTLTACYPELVDDDAANDALWASGPLIDNASGPIAYIGLKLDRFVNEGWRYCVETAHSQGLVAFDPQSDALANLDPTAAPAAPVPPRRRGGAVYRWAALRSWRWPLLRPLLPLLRRFR
jgi:hypothetical protein